MGLSLRTLQRYAASGKVPRGLFGLVVREQLGARHFLHAQAVKQAQHARAWVASLERECERLRSVIRAYELAQTQPAANAPACNAIQSGGVQAPRCTAADEAALSRATYKNLFEAIGTAYGAGDGSSTFNIPDLRGRFARGTDQGKGRDPNVGTRQAEPANAHAGDRVGPVQDDMFKSHTQGYQKSPNGGGGIASGSYWKHAPAQSGATGGNETRPKNLNVNWIIKATHLLPG